MMFKDMYFRVYRMDLWAATAIVIGAIIVWSLIGALLKKKMRVISAVAAVLAAGLILYITIFSREDAVAAHQIRPFATIMLASQYPGLYRAALMNIFLFVPLGMALPYVIKADIRRRILFSILIGGCLSAGIEVAQHFLMVGMTQTDDVICNTLGTALGTCAYLLTLLWMRIKK